MNASESGFVFYELCTEEQWITVIVSMYISVTLRVNSISKCINILCRHYIIESKGALQKLITILSVKAIPYRL